MVFQNPWGLLALLAIPAILALHFFRSRRRVRRIGGLHLWSFARTQLPIGNRWDRLTRNLPLLFQLLAALLLALLIAGLDFPQTAAHRHYTLIVDNSFSMQATPAEGETVAARARRLVADWAGDDQFTLIEAGVRPRVVAGPFGTRRELLAALEAWQPADPASDLPAALNLAAKFTTGAERALLLTDDAAPAQVHAGMAEAAALGAPLANVAITYATRVQATAARDRIVLTLQAYGGAAREVTLQAASDGQTFHREAIAVEPGAPVSHVFETDQVARPIRLWIEDDALNADNAVELAPERIKSVGVAFTGLGDAEPFFRRGALAVAATHLAASPAEAELVFAVGDEHVQAPRNVVLCRLPQPDGAREAAVAQGRDILVDRNRPIVEGLALEGVLWPYDAATTSAATRLLEHRGRPLLTQQELGEGRLLLAMNLLADRTNIYRQTAWPMLMQGIIEASRAAMPGLVRHNFQAGEPIELNLKPDPALPARFALLRGETAVAEYEALPGVLSGLAAGAYTLRQGEGQVLASFNVNLFAPAESDLSRVEPRKPDFAALAPEALQATQANMPLYFFLLVMLILCTALAWKYQDTSL